MLCFNSVVDLGCGVGTWLKVCEEQWGLSDVQGLDGSWIDMNLLEIEEDRFRAVDFESPLNLGGKYDLGI